VGLVGPGVPVPLGPGVPVPLGPGVPVPLGPGVPVPLGPGVPVPLPVGGGVGVAGTQGSSPNSHRAKSKVNPDPHSGFVGVGVVVTGFGVV